MTSKLSILFAVLSLLLLPKLGAAQAVLDTTGGRYHQPIFPTITVTSGIVYGSAPNVLGLTQPLVLDLYEPAGDTVRRRPLLIFAHQGAFVRGSRSEQYMVALCTRLAQLGYVTASIDYRLLFLPLDTVGVARATIRAGQDMRAAVRFFRQDAATGQRYRIHPDYVAVGGASAGGIMALQVGYLDKPAEVPAYFGLETLGGIEGNSGNPGYSSQPFAVLNLSGGTESVTLIEAGNAPLCSVHGTADVTVPYLAGRVGVGLPPKYIVGSGLLHPRATQVGVRNTLRTLRGAEHVPQYGTSPRELAYADTTFRTLRDFLRPLLRPVGAVLAAGSPAPGAEAAQAYPVPAAETVHVILPDAWLITEVELLDVTGRVVRSFRPRSSRFDLTRDDLRAGIYFLRAPGLRPLRLLFE